jgi:fatty acid desaturase
MANKTNAMEPQMEAMEEEEHLALSDTVRKYINEDKVPTPNLQFYDRFIMNFINDPRDLVFIHFMVLFTIYHYTMLFIQIKYGFNMYLGAIHAALMLRYTGRFILLLHCTSHRKLFKERYSFISRWITWVLGPFFGQTPNTYYFHHIRMHHVENNGPTDLSSTLLYQRDSIIGFATYFSKFFFGTPIQLPSYFLSKKRYIDAFSIFCGEMSWQAVHIYLLYNYYATGICMFTVPICIVRFAMMAGNWAQHAFIDKDIPFDDYRSSITCIACGYNKLCFNDGYHTSHHLNPKRHWTEHPIDLEKKAHKYVQHTAIVFQGLDFFVIWFLLMAKQYKILVNHLVFLDGKVPKQDEAIAILKSRLKRFTKEEVAAKMKQTIVPST